MFAVYVPVFLMLGVAITIAATLFTLTEVLAKRVAAMVIATPSMRKTGT